MRRKSGLHIVSPKRRRRDPDYLIDAEEGTLDNDPGTMSAGGGAGTPETSGKAYAKKRYFGLRTTLIVVSIINVFVILGLFAYSSIVMTYFTFTFETQFPQDTVPFYEAPASDVPHRQATRLHMWWWFVALQLLRVFSVVGTHMALAHAAVTGQRAPVTAMMVLLAIYGLYDLAITGFVIIIDVTLAKCAATPFCRSWDASPGEASSTAGVANWVFQLFTWFSLAFFVVHVVYFFVLWTARAKLVKAALAAKSPSETKQR